MNGSDTPETDRAEDAWRESWARTSGKEEMASVARNLERQRDALLGAIADLLECFGAMEGTWYQREWRGFGISKEMEALMERAWDTKYGKK